MATTTSTLTPDARLRFYRWLVETGRLSDYPPTEADVTQAGQALTAALDTVLPETAYRCACLNTWKCQREGCQVCRKCIHGVCPRCFCDRCEA